MTQAQTKNDVLRVIQQNEAYLRAHGIIRIGLFGSFQRNEQTASSDVDLLVEFAPAQKNFRNFMTIINYLEDSLQRNIELITPESLSPYLGPKILKEVEYVSFAN